MIKIKFKIKLLITPGFAKPTPPIAPILGQYGINLLDFCKRFNDLTKNIKKDIISTKIIYYDNNKYDILISDTPVSLFIKKYFNINLFSKKPGLEIIKKISFNDLNEISLKKNIFEKKNINSVRKMILGTLFSLGIGL